ncbi:hypothetical protein ACMGD3_09525 [Lysinibacillus sphaericus]|uniref:hypothetical protein n=1 Tax=Lysinibacillus sphaericus TaxID=1421 RepID=UPI003F799BAB
MNLHDYEYRIGQGVRTDLSPNGEKLDKHATLASVSGVGKGSIGRLVTVKRNRPDLYEKVFDGSYSIGRAHAEMKYDETPPTTEDEP